jgi:hypothetical protein
MAKSSSRRSKTAKPVYEPEPSPRVPPSSPSFSPMDDTSDISEIRLEAYGYSASHPWSPTQSDVLDTEINVSCQWEDCGKVFTHLPTFRHHIHNGKFWLVLGVCLRSPKLREGTTNIWQTAPGCFAH